MKGSSLDTTTVDFFQNNTVVKKGHVFNFGLDKQLFSKDIHEFKAIFIRLDDID